VKKINPEELSGDASKALGFLQAMLTLRAALSVQDQTFHDAVRRLSPSIRNRHGWLPMMTRQDADGVRVVLQDPLDAAAYSILPSYTAAPLERPLGWDQEPIAFVGIPSRWASAVAQQTGVSGSSPLRGPPFPGHQLVPPPRASLVASPVALWTTAPSSRADPVPPKVNTVDRVATANRFPLARPVPDSLPQDTSAMLGSEEEVCCRVLLGVCVVRRLGFPPACSWSSWSICLGACRLTYSPGQRHTRWGTPTLWRRCFRSSRQGVNDHLWRLLNIQQQLQGSMLRLVELAGTGRARGSGTGDLRDDSAGAHETNDRDAPGSPQRGTGGGGNQTWSGGY